MRCRTIQLRRTRGGKLRVGVALLLAIAWIGLQAGSAAAQPSTPATPQPQTASAPAQASAPKSNKWQFEITPYFFAAGMDGTVGVEGVTGNVDMGVGDVLDRMDGAFMGMVEARKGPWAMIFDGAYVHLKGEKTSEWQGPGGVGTATGNLAADATEKVYSLVLGRRVVDEAGGSKADLIFGVRMTEIDSRLDLVTSTGGSLPGNTRSVDDSQNWLDPIVGLRLLFPFADHWTLVGYADLGGFGIASDMTSQALVGVNWEMTKRFVAKLGYRYLMDDYRDDGFVWDIATHGPYAGLGIRF